MLPLATPSWRGQGRLCRTGPPTTAAMPTQAPPEEAKSSVGFRITHAEQPRPPPASPHSPDCSTTHRTQRTQPPLLTALGPAAVKLPSRPLSPTAPARVLLSDLQDLSPGSCVCWVDPCPPSPGVGNSEGRDRGRQRGLWPMASQAPPAVGHLSARRQRLCPRREGASSWPRCREGPQMQSPA